MNPSPSLSRRAFLHRTAALAAAGATRGWSAADSPPPRWQIGCYTRPFDQFDYRVALDAIAEAGFKYAGIMTAKGKSWLMVTTETPVDEAAAIGDEIRKRGLKAISLYGGDFPVAESLAAGIDGLKKLIDNCAACGAPNLMLGGTGSEALYPRYYEAVAECCDYAAAKHIGLSVKPHGGLNATGPQCRQAIERVGHANFQLWYDPGNIYYYSDGARNPVDDAATVDGLVVGMSIKDFQPPKEVMVTPGTGQVDFAKVLARLRQGGFNRGPLVVECLARGDLAQLKAEARKTREFLEQLTG